MKPYGKIHESFYDSSIVETNIETRYVFQSMIVLSDQDGRIDMTRQALARRINVPLETLNHAIEVLSAPDEMSRTAENDGRRILPIDPARPWGWIVVNKSVYRHSNDDRREYERERKREQRRRKRESQRDSADADANADADTYTESPGNVRDSGASSGLGLQERQSLFDERWKLYPRKDGRKSALRHFLASVKTADDMRRFDAALRNYLTLLRVEKRDLKHTKNGSTFFCNWNDFVDWQPATGETGAAHDFSDLNF